MTSTATYPSREKIESIFKPMETGDFATTFEHVSPDVNWTLMGTHPLAGTYTSKEDFINKTLNRLNAIIKEPGIQLRIRNIIGGGDQPWATLELIARAECNNGFKFHNTYAWVVRFDENEMVVEARGYLDSWMVKEAIETNEVPSKRAPLPEI